MANGKPEQETQHSLIAQAIALAEVGTTGEIRVHLSKRFFEKDPFRRAQKLFQEYGMNQTSQRNAVLLYVNLRRHKISVVGDEGVQKAVGQSFWESLILELRRNLHATHQERAIAVSVTMIGNKLRKHFPAREATG